MNGECGPNSHTWLRFKRTWTTPCSGRFCVTCDREEYDDGSVRPGYKGGPSDVVIATPYLGEEMDKVIPSQTLSVHIDIKSLSRMEMLELRDDITDLLVERFGCRIAMSVDGTAVYLVRAKPGDAPVTSLESLVHTLIERRRSDKDR